MRRVSACGPAWDPVPEVVTVRFICIAMLSSKVFTPWLPELGACPSTTAEPLEPVPGCEGGATFALVGGVLRFSRSTPAGVAGAFGSSALVPVGVVTGGG